MSEDEELQFNLMFNVIVVENIKPNVKDYNVLNSVTSFGRYIKINVTTNSPFTGYLMGAIGDSYYTSFINFFGGKYSQKFESTETEDPGYKTYLLDFTVPSDLLSYISGINYSIYTSFPSAYDLSEFILHLLPIREYSLKLKFVNLFGEESNEIQFPITITNETLPELFLMFHQVDTVPLEDQELQCRITYLFGQKCTIFYSVNGESPTIAKRIEDAWDGFIYDNIIISHPETAGTYEYSFWIETDDGKHSNNQSIQITYHGEINHEPEDFINSYLHCHYLSSYTISQDYNLDFPCTIRGMSKYFEINFKVRYVYLEDNSTVVKEYRLNRNTMTERFEILLKANVSDFIKIGNYDLYLSLNDGLNSSEETKYSITTYSSPVLISVNSSKTVFSVGDSINLLTIFNTTLKQNRGVYIGYKIDDSSKEINNYYSIQNQYNEITINIQETIYLTGPHSIHVKIEADGRKSNTLTFNFEISTSIKPIIKVKSLTDRYSFTMPDMVVPYQIGVIDYNIGQEVNIYVKDDTDNIQFIRTIIANRKYEYFNFNFQFPYAQKRNILTFFANDTSGFYSDTLSKSFYVDSQPNVIVISEKMKRRYLMNSNCTIEYYITNPLPGSRHKVEYKINNEIITTHEDILILDNYSSGLNIYEIQLPDKYAEYNVEISIKGLGWPKEIRFVVDNPPVIEWISNIKDEYALSEIIEINLSVKASTSIYIQYKVSDEDSWINTSRKDEIKNITLKILASDKPGWHNLSIQVFIIDKFESEITSMNYYATSKHAPILNIGSSPNFKFHEKKQIKIESNDQDLGNKVDVFLSIEDGKFNFLYSYISTKEFNKYNYIYNEPLVAGSHKLTFMAIDETNISTTKTVTFDLVQYQTIDFIGYFDSTYPSNFVLNKSRYIKDYLPGSKVAIFYEFDSHKQYIQASEYVYINESCISELIDCSITMLSNTGMHTLKIIAMEEGNLNPSNKIEYKIHVNNPPKLLYWEPIKEKYFKNSNIEIKCILKDSDRVSIRYSFNDVEYFWDGKYYDLNDDNSTISIDIPLPDNLRAGINYIEIYFRDYFSLDSEKMNQSFVFDINEAPKVNVSRNYNSYYKFHENVTFNVQLFDANPVYIMKSLNGIIYTILFKFHC
ncbi:hypothetical protein TVAG_450610 [Trichomonas vaginalis G3]|uniref:Bap-like n=1 Tax=Trichomonas vaginalis (strain ATCC PRA-98 / G3) TaxID=412133 RepID=A2EV38_TRIV3|nr:hypothetical protein TVAGG3_0946280 [Trichomonas vaginalis G3]EAY03488.1 hypothetical protein TVAG_450610 [Trichomonas vaginalis G3]KAI5486897.1 hypothetical protein TVAGG3_0946280 [Trichomonas vaginalis G3]|eukprot:XP_001315711.1 hypothetical protein [Trichomonas vaginalis G3]